MDPRIKQAQKRPPSLAAKDPKKAAALLLAGEASLADVAGVTEEDLTQLRVTAGELLRKGLFEKCLQLVDALLALGDEHPLLPFLRAECQERQGDLPAARDTLRNAIENARAFELPDLVKDAEAHLTRLQTVIGEASEPPGVSADEGRSPSASSEAVPESSDST